MQKSEAELKKYGTLHKVKASEHFWRFFKNADWKYTAELWRYVYNKGKGAVLDSWESEGQYYILINGVTHFYGERGGEGDPYSKEYDADESWVIAVTPLEIVKERLNVDKA